MSHFDTDGVEKALWMLPLAFVGFGSVFLMHSSCMMQMQANNGRQDRIEQELWQLRMHAFTAMEGVGRVSGRLDGMAMEMGRLNGVLERTNEGIVALQAATQAIAQRLDGGQQ